MNRAAAIQELAAAFADMTILRVVDPGADTLPHLVPAAFAMEHGTVLALALNGLFREGIVIVEHEGYPIAMHAACGGSFFDAYGLNSRAELIAGWADFYQEPVSNFTLRPSREDDSDTFEIDLEMGKQVSDLRDALLVRCAAAIAVLQR